MTLQLDAYEVTGSAARDAVVQRARELQPLLEKNAGEAERLRRLPDENIDALRAAGLFRLAIPQRCGGYELPLHVRKEVYEAIGAGCGSTGWVVEINNELAWLGGLFSEQAQQEFFGDNPDAIMAGSFAPQASVRVRRVAGGQMASGAWNFTSGCWHADWCGLTVPLVDEAGQPAGEGMAGAAWAYVPRSQISVKETWDVVGMRGTGTHTMVVEDEIFIPDHRLLPWNFLLEPFDAPGPRQFKDEVIYRVSGLTPGLLINAPMLGQARAALQYVLDRAGSRGVTYSPYLRQVDSVAFQLQISDAAMKIETADLHLKRAIQELEDFGGRGERPDFRTSSRIQSETGFIGTQLRDAVGILMSAHGSSAFAASSPLQRIWRDVNVGTRHGFLNPALCRETFGKSLLGLMTVGPLPEPPDQP